MGFMTIDLAAPSLPDPSFSAKRISPPLVCQWIPIDETVNEEALFPLPLYLIAGHVGRNHC